MLLISSVYFLYPPECGDEDRHRVLKLFAAKPAGAYLTQVFLSKAYLCYQPNATCFLYLRSRKANTIPQCITPYVSVIAEKI